MKKVLLSTITIAIISASTVAQIVSIPDANFKSYLVGNAGINTNADSEIQVSEAAAFAGTISINGLSISDLTGIEAFIALENLYANGTSITTLDLSNNLNLMSVYCNVSALTSLNVSNNTNLQELYCSNNSLTELDLNSNTSLTKLSCLDNNLTSLKVANGNNTNFTTFNATNNPNLTCIEVDDVAWSSANWIQIDAGASFSLNCCVVNIPDANFKAYLVGNSAINTNSDNEIQCSEATAFTGVIDCGYSNITDMTGIEAFTEITELRCYGNNFSSLDVSQNLELEELYCQDNSNMVSIITGSNTNLQYINASMSTSLYQLDVSQNSSLVFLNLEDTGFSSLDVTANSSLETLLLTYTYISSIDLSQNTALTTLALFGSYSLNAIDVSNCTNLSSLNCVNINSLTALNLKNLSSSTLTSFYATGNPNLTCIEVDDVADATANWTNIDPTASFSLNCNVAGLKEQIGARTLQIAPNPSKGDFTLKIDGLTQEITLTVIDNMGRIITSEKYTSSNTIDFSLNVHPGLYMVVGKTNDGEIMKQRLIIQ